MKDFKKFPYNYFPTCLGGGRVKEERKISLHMNFFFLKASLTFGKGATISGFMDSTEVSDSTITHDGVKSVMSQHNVTQNTFRQVDVDDRVKKICNSRQRPYKDIQYQ